MEEEDLRQPNSRKTSAVLRRELLEKHNYSCSICGIKNDDVPLEIAHLIPLYQGGDTSEDNLTLLCPNCHGVLDSQPREIEFVDFLSGLLNKHPNFENLKKEVLLGSETRFRGDILVKRKEGSRQQTLVIECKTSRVLHSATLKNIINQLRTYQNLCNGCYVVLAVAGTLLDQDLALLQQHMFEVWDLDYIAVTFATQIKESPISYYKALLLSRLARAHISSQEQSFIDDLKACQPGKKDCYVYQSLIGDILEYLFTPPLAKPIPELSDKVLANRRDFILPNYSEKGFWAFMREKYVADYIVIDAKNYTRKVKKDEVLQIANYLKPHGAGLFGIIICRKGGDSAGCEHTLREQWLVHKKLILVLNDEDIEKMLVAKLDGNPPEDLISQKIEQFRLSM
ncbi:MAG: HNH endonuclease signature motif containing protein [Cyanobacteria bacterium J06635_15]